MASISRAALTTIAGKAVGPVGYGMLGLTIPWAPVEYPVAVKALKTALEQGANFWNGSLHYGTPQANSLHLIKHYFEQYPEDANKVVLSIKGAYHPKEGPNGSPEGIRASVEEAVNVLPPSIKPIDIFECARVDPKVPIETSIKALVELVKEGKIRGVGLSEANANTIRKAHAIYPISAVEIELSLFTPDPLHNGVTDVCHELSIPIAAYSPISRGWLTGELRKLDDLAENDFRRMLPRFKPENFDQNLRLVEAVGQIAKGKGVTTAQVAIGWVCRQGAIPIPGSTKEARIIENCKPAYLTDEDMAEIQKILDTLPISGERYGGQHEAMLNG
ncbi:NADP-dependent oxidoreductase domain-containing protein [Halenospora varia]|nr:NADP-dependent oxidoreductase domain-containing protein [Halenospora varia]